MSVRVILLLAVALTGCASRMAPAPPSTLVTPAQWRTESGATGTVARDWWAAFGDPALVALVDEALRQNGDVRIAGARMAAARARLTIADAAQLPALNATGQPDRARTLNAFGQPVVNDVFQVGVQASYELDVWGRLAHASGSALASLQAERANADAVALSIAASVASGYLNLRGLDAQLALADATLELRAQSLALARRQFDAGYSSRLEQLQAQTEYDVTAELVPQLRRAIFEQESALATLVGRNPGDIVRGRALDALAPPPVPVGLPSDLLRRRPDIYRAQRTLAAQQASLAATAEAALPSFRLTAGGGVESFHLSQLVHAPTALWNVALGVTAPLYEGGRLQAATDAAAAQRDEALFAYESVVRGAFAETENSLQAIARLREQAGVTQARRATAAEALRIAHRRHADGYASYLEELDAQRTVYSADVSLLQLHARSLIAAVDLYRAMGGGWSDAGLAGP